jgi:hypothetical protein
LESGADGGGGADGFVKEARQLVAAIAFAAAVVRYWKEILARIVIAILVLAALGLLTLLDQWRPAR